MVAGNPVSRSRLIQAGCTVYEYAGADISVKGGGTDVPLPGPCTVRYKTPSPHLGSWCDLFYAFRSFNPSLGREPDFNLVVTVPFSEGVAQGLSDALSAVAQYVKSHCPGSFAYISKVLHKTAP